MRFCQVCGNGIGREALLCRFCGSRQEGSEGSITKVFLHRTVNLEKGMPVVEAAMNQLYSALQDARLNNIQALTIIHGYGSSGQGGAIRQECRKTLDYMCSRGELQSYIPGEEFHRRNGSVKNLLSRYPQLADNSNLNRTNRGITLVIL